MLTKSALPVITHRPNSLDSLRAGIMVTLNENNFTDLKKYLYDEFGVVLRKFTRKDKRSEQEVTAASLHLAEHTTREEQIEHGFRGREMGNLMFNIVHDERSGQPILVVTNVHDARKPDEFRRHGVPATWSAKSRAA